MEAEEEWESELAENIRRLYESGGADAAAIIVDGTSVRMKYGLVLISGNVGDGGGSTSTEVYNYRDNTLRLGPTKRIARSNHASAILPTGDVALFGGYNRNMTHPQMSSCEVFSLKTKSFCVIGDMMKPRDGAAAILLNNGLVLVIGGGLEDTKRTDTCELYNKSRNKFSRSKAKLIDARIGHTASLLPDGRVLVCGGWNGEPCFQTTEIYDQRTDSFSAGPLMTVKRDGHTATTLDDGRILLTGGENGISSNSTEVYDPTTNCFSKGPKMVVERVYHFSALLPDGRVLLGGGDSDENKHTTEIYDPKTDSFTKGLNLLHARMYASASNF
jgi:hypothetical protein